MPAQAFADMLSSMEDMSAKAATRTSSAKPAVPELFEISGAGLVASPPRLLGEVPPDASLTILLRPWQLTSWKGGLVFEDDRSGLNRPNTAFSWSFEPGKHLVPDSRLSLGLSASGQMKPGTATEAMSATLAWALPKHGKWASELRVSPQAGVELLAGNLSTSLAPEFVTRARVSRDRQSGTADLNLKVGALLSSAASPSLTLSAELRLMPAF